MTAKKGTTKRRGRVGKSESDLVASRKAKVIKSSLMAAYAITKRLEELRKVDLEALSQPMTL